MISKKFVLPGAIITTIVAGLLVFNVVSPSFSLSSRISNIVQFKLADDDIASVPDEKDEPEIVAVSGDSKIIKVVAENDWSISRCDVRADNTGIYWTPDKANLYKTKALIDNVHGVATAKYTTPRYAPIIQINWSAVEKTKGQYNFAALDKSIKDITALGDGAGYVIWAHSKGIPSWANQEAGTNFGTAKNLWKTKNADGSYKFNTLFKGYAEAITKRYGNDPQMVAIEMRSPFDAKNGEWSLSSANGGRDQEAGPWAVAWHRVWYDAMKKVNGDPGKLVMMTAQESIGGVEVVKEGYRLGLGQRDGIPSAAHIWENGYGISTKDGYFTIDESHLNFTSLQTGRLSYSENTEHVFHKSDPWGDPVNAYELMRYALSWNLKIGRNWISYPGGIWAEIDKNTWPYNQISNEAIKAEYKNAQEMMWWSEYQLGKDVTTTKDVYTVLGERKYTHANWSGGGKTAIIKNTGRWMEQRDVATGQTRPADHAENIPPYLASWRLDGNGEYFARRTDLASNNPNMFFDVDSRYSTGSGLEVMVTYMKDATTSFKIQYSNGSEIITSDEVKVTKSNGRRETVTISLPGFKVDGKFKGMDFKLVNTGTKDVSVDMVRLTRSCN